MAVWALEEKTWTTNLSCAILNILPHLSSLWHIAVHTLNLLACDTGVICSTNCYLLNMMSVTKNSNQNYLQQVEMRLHHVYFHCTCNTTWSTAHESCIILWTFEDIARSAYVKTLAYTTGTTSKHQRATWPELYPKSIVFLPIVAWHMRVFTHLPNVWGYGEGMLWCYQRRWKNAFLLRILKLPRIRMWQPRNQ